MKQAHKNNLLRSIRLLCTLLLLTGCGAANAVAPTESEPAVAEETVTEEPVADEPAEDLSDLERMPGIANPWSDADAAAVAEMIGTEVPVPEGAANITYRILSAENIAEVAYDLNDAHCNHRLKKTDAEEDISGLYYNWESTEESTYEGHAATIYRADAEEESVELTLWFDAESSLMHALSSTTAK
ncbi:MAG: hypothetical protein IJR00_02500 [Lachnospiraceae bacterium]|nr:hypothetical protein [Lachnospiraceae bacterium]